MGDRADAGGPDWGDPWTIVAGDPLGSPLPAVAAGLLILYVLGVVRLRRRGRSWPPGRTLIFALGCAALAAVTAPGVESWGARLFSVFMFQQLTLMIAVPPLLVLGSPGSLLLAAAPHRGVGRIVLVVAFAGLRCRATRLVTHPVTTVGLFLGAYYGLYLSGAVNALVPSRSGHLVLETVFLAAGLLFAVPILATDPVPGRASPVVSLLEQFIEMGLHAFFGVIVMFGGSLLVPAFAASTRQAGLDPLEDQRIAGALAWSYGEGPAVVLLIVLMHRWFRADTRRAAARDARVAAEGDRELDAYNAYLAGLTEEQDPTRRHGSRRPGPESDTG